MKIATAPPSKAVTVSPITRRHSVFRYFFPFQSWWQFVHTLIILTVVLSLCAVPIYLYDPEIVLVSVLSGIAGGLSLGVYPMLPAHMRLTTRGEARHFAQDLYEHMASQRYVECSSSSTSKRYRNKLPWWFRWKEQEVEITVSSHAIDVNGPVMALRLLTLLLNRAEDERNRMG